MGFLSTETELVPEELVTVCTATKGQWQPLGFCQISFVLIPASSWPAFMASSCNRLTQWPCPRLKEADAREGTCALRWWFF